MTSHRELHGAASFGLYLFAATLTFWPVADLLLSVSPPQPADLQWRYGTIGLLSSYLHTPMIGGLLAGVTAWYNGNVGLLKALSIGYLVAGLALLAAMAVFSLDLMDVRTLRPPEMRTAVLLGGVAAAAKIFSAASVLALLGIGGLKMVSEARRARKPAPSAGIVARATTGTG